MAEREYRGISLTEKHEDFTVIDVETTGYFSGYDEIIEFSGVKVRNGKIVDSFSTLVNPTREIDEFISGLTGITNEMLETAPNMNDVIDKIVDFIGDDIIVGHNVSFDVNFIYDTLLEYRSQYLKNDFLDTLRLSRKLFKDLDNHQLCTLAHAFNKKYFPSHRGMNDCLATYELIQYIYKYLDDNELELKSLFKRKYNSKRLDLKSIVVNVDEIDEDNPLFGLSVCFTGTLNKMVRKDALQLVANLGGKPMDSVTKETNLLVLGDVDYKNSKDDKKSNKYKKAEALILKGFDLKIISESTFLDMIDDDLEKEYYR